ncbi:MAG: hypothetical protein DRR16_11980 [Candidatus Parabeggiatoa sp. nov. 3]|nr:MAG: hypothetical protein DRR00_05740 [Gammaproteobacteria bacterium]RKZ68034.1 MAG: hypothetical protein DRQ99_04955 [Gammaproteobacteria bacterium]RKZ85471.1 MAG: hypothetical protein DRR16_11980 [Gammaproteobacteria bacterium]
MFNFHKFNKPKQPNQNNPKAKKTMRHCVGIVTSHLENVNPDNSDYTLFFDMLKTQGQTIELIQESLDPTLLQNYETLLIGVPHSPLRSSECDALRQWLKEGGQLLLLSSFGGDSAPDGQELKRNTNIDYIVKDISFPDLLFGFFEEAPSDSDFENKEPFFPKVSINISHLVRQPATFCYDTGTIIDIPNTAEFSYTKNWKKRGKGTIWPDGRKQHDAACRSWQVTHSISAPNNTYFVEGVRLEDNRVVADEYASANEIRSHNDFLFLRMRQGEGIVCILGSAWSFKNATLRCEDNVLFLNELFLLWLPNLMAEELQHRQTTPQRHRLLHGYPMAPMMFPIQKAGKPRVNDINDLLYFDKQRHQVIGVLPHPFCNPKVRGCGFCTFPHETYHATQAQTIVDKVIQEIDSFSNHYSKWCQRPVTALYFGGGTANLTPPEAFRKLCQKLTTTFDLRQAEITLEGVPIYFLAKQPSLLQIMQEEILARHFRISLGIQTFNPKQIKRMGREAFGDREKIAQVVRLAQSQNISVSGDFLINLPGQTLEQMQDDISQALDMGLEHICLYHLVLFERLGTVWSQDKTLIEQLSTNAIACEHWLTLRERLLQAGFIQTSLTNFEARKIHKTSRRYEYENAVYSPERYDTLGFGTSGIHYLSNFQQKQALKLLNFTQSSDYEKAIEERGKGWAHFFSYGSHDLKIFYLTRKIAMLDINIAAYKSLFSTQPQDDFPMEFEALQNTQLIKVKKNHIQLTPVGMFYADSVAGLLAWRQVHYYRLKQMRDAFTAPVKNIIYDLEVNQADLHFMG